MLQIYFSGQYWEGFFEHSNSRIRKRILKAVVGWEFIWWEIKNQDFKFCKSLFYIIKPHVSSRSNDWSSKSPNQWWKEKPYLTPVHLHVGYQILAPADKDNFRGSEIEIIRQVALKQQRGIVEMINYFRKKMEETMFTRFNRKIIKAPKK